MRSRIRRYLPPSATRGRRAPFDLAPTREAGDGAEGPDLSLVAPVFDEEPNLVPLYERVVEVFGSAVRWELVLVDDGSRDGSRRVMGELRGRDRRVRCIFFERNCGQTTAMRAGVLHARAPLIATLDADLQNDPADIPSLVEHLGTADAVVGYRLRREDDFVRRASSRIANAIRNRLSGDSIRDTGCSLKVFRAAAIRELPLHFEGMHRFLPTLLRYSGYVVVEHPVSHHPRRAGVSKYGIRNRALRALRDLFAVRWMRSRLRRLPIVTEESDLVRAR